MKQYQSTEEGNWIEILNVDLQEEYTQLRQMMESGDHEGVKALSDSIKAKKEAVVTGQEAAALQAFYESKKPALAEGETYQLIAIDMTGEAGAYTGILNCRVNGEHVQVRF